MSDLIERQDAIDIVCDALDQMPSAEKRGHWINEPYLNGTVIFRCSNCLHAAGIGSSESDEHFTTWFRYCPNCGAKMEELT